MMRRRVSVVLLLASMPFLLCACKKRNQAWEERPQPDNLEELRALGYIDYSETLADLSKKGARIHAPKRVYPGYGLYTLTKECSATLIDMIGKPVHRWIVKPCDNLGIAAMARNGDLVVPGTEPTGTEDETRPFLALMGFDGKERWRKYIHAHHDVELNRRADGFLALTLTHRKVAAYDKMILDNNLAYIDINGDTKRELSMWDMVARNKIGFTLNRVGPYKQWYDVLHANSVEQMHSSSLAARHPIYSLHNVMVASRHQNSVFIFDTVNRELVWAWGRGELDGPHDATVLDNGRILVFDNGLERGWSRVVEVDPIARKVVWQYRGDDRNETTFYSRSRGTSQRLPNGNTLLCNSNSGQVLEISPDGQPVWEFFNPVVNRKGHRAVVVFMRRFNEDLVERLLESTPTG